MDHFVEIKLINERNYNNENKYNQEISDYKLKLEQLEKNQLHMSKNKQDDKLKSWQWSFLKWWLLVSQDLTSWSKIHTSWQPKEVQGQPKEVQGQIKGAWGREEEEEEEEEKQGDILQSGDNPPQNEEPTYESIKNTNLKDYANKCIETYLSKYVSNDSNKINPLTKLKSLLNNSLPSAQLKFVENKWEINYLTMTENMKAPAIAYGLVLYDLYLSDLGKELNGEQALLYFLVYLKNRSETHLLKVENLINNMHKLNPNTKKQNLIDLFKKYSSNNAESKILIKNVLEKLKDSDKKRKPKK